MSQARILSQIDSFKKSVSPSREEKSKREKGEIFLEQTLLLLNGTPLIDELLKQNPSLLNHLPLDLPPTSKQFDLGLLIKHSKWLLSNAIECGNEEASYLLKTLEEQKTLTDKNDCFAVKLLSLNEENEVETNLFQEIIISDHNHFKY